jgi:chromate transporter
LSRAAANPEHVKPPAACLLVAPRFWKVIRHAPREHGWHGLLTERGNVKRDRLARELVWSAPRCDPRSLLDAFENHGGAFTSTHASVEFVRPRSGAPEKKSGEQAMGLAGLDWRILMTDIDPSEIVVVERVQSSTRFALGPAVEVLRIFFRLGLTSFGGPVAHLGYFREEFVVRRGWLDEPTYTDIVALCQFLPGPASSQVGMTIGMLRAGLLGAFCAWLGFTTPSAVALIVFAYGITRLGDLREAAWLHGLKIVAVAVVAQAVWGMARTLWADRERASLGIGAAVLALALPSTMAQLGIIVLGGLIGWCWLSAPANNEGAATVVPVSRGLGIAALAVFVALLIGLPVAAGGSTNQSIKLIDSFYRSGSLVFGGGHVVLPLLRQEVVPTGWISEDAFLAGYGAAQAVPGPLFTFAAYLGTAMRPAPNGWLGGLLCLFAIFLPSFLLLTGMLPFWDDVRKRSAVQSALQGVNAAVVGLLLAALYTPLFSAAINGPTDFIIAILAVLLLAFWKVPPWLVVGLGALGTAGIAQFG